MLEPFIIKDSWGDSNGNKYYKIHVIIWIKEEYGWRYFVLMRLNESGTVLEWNHHHRDVIRSEEEDDVPENYPTEIGPDIFGSVYRIYYRQ